VHHHVSPLFTFIPLSLINQKKKVTGKSQEQRERAANILLALSSQSVMRRYNTPRERERERDRERDRERGRERERKKCRESRDRHK
jgi:hypothetical protein